MNNSVGGPFHHGLFVFFWVGVGDGGGSGSEVIISYSGHLRGESTTEAPANPDRQIGLSFPSRSPRPTALRSDAMALNILALHGCGSNQWYHFGVGAPPILVYFSRDSDVHWGYGVSTQVHIDGIVFQRALFLASVAICRRRIYHSQRVEHVSNTELANRGFGSPIKQALKTSTSALSPFRHGKQTHFAY